MIFVFGLITWTFSLSVAVIQIPGRDMQGAIKYIEKSAAAGAKVILLPELFENDYFPREKDKKFFALAKETKDHPSLQVLSSLAKKLQVVIIFPFFEKFKKAYYDSAAIIDSDGKVLGVYRKTHIPSTPGYFEKFYFKPGDTGLKVWSTHQGKIGVAICWDQWFPEVARILTLQGAEIILYPSAIGSEPQDPTFDTMNLWQNVMIGHAISNVIPVAAANRIGQEGELLFYGSSFVADHLGRKVASLNRTETGFAQYDFDMNLVVKSRKNSGLISDRRPRTYGRLLRK